TRKPHGHVYHCPDCNCLVLASATKPEITHHCGAKLDRAICIVPGCGQPAVGYTNDLPDGKRFCGVVAYCEAEIWGERHPVMRRCLECEEPFLAHALGKESWERFCSN